MYHLSTEMADDYWEVEYLYDLSFAPGREALSSYRLRDGVSPVADLCRIARDEDTVLAGAIRYWPICIGGDHAALLLGPIAVHPTRQGEGLGGLLMRDSLGLARAAGWERVVLIGDEPYYGKFGFEKNAGLQFPPPTNPERVLSLPLVEGGFSGVRGEIASATS